MSQITKISPVTPQYLKTSQASEYLGLSRRFMHDLTQSGRLPYHRISPRCFLFKLSDLDAFVSSCRIGGSHEMD